MYTSHGHYIKGTPLADEEPSSRARCGGFSACPLCIRETIIARNELSEKASDVDLPVKIMQEFGLTEQRSLLVLLTMVEKGVLFFNKEKAPEIMKAVRDLYAPAITAEEMPEHNGVKAMQCGGERVRSKSSISLSELSDIRRAYEFFERIGVSPDGCWETIEMFMRDGVDLTEVIGK